MTLTNSSSDEKLKMLQPVNGLVCVVFQPKCGVLFTPENLHPIQTMASPVLRAVYDSANLLFANILKMQARDSATADLFGGNPFTMHNTTQYYFASVDENYIAWVLCSDSLTDLKKFR